MQCVLPDKMNSQGAFNCCRRVDFKSLFGRGLKIKLVIMKHRGQRVLLLISLGYQVIRPYQRAPTQSVTPVPGLLSRQYFSPQLGVHHPSANWKCLILGWFFDTMCLFLFLFCWIISGFTTVTVFHNINYPWSASWRIGLNTSFGDCEQCRPDSAHCQSLAHPPGLVLPGVLNYRHAILTLVRKSKYKSQYGIYPWWALPLLFSGTASTNYLFQLVN